MFPRTLANNMAFVFTNVSSPLAWNYDPTSIPMMLRDVPRFPFDNPIAVQRRYISLSSGQKIKAKKKESESLRGAVQESEQKALGVLVDLFDWLDGVEPQPTKEIVYLYNLSQTIESMITNTLAQMDQAAATKVEINKLIAELKGNSDVSPLNLLPLVARPYPGWK